MSKQREIMTRDGGVVEKNLDVAVGQGRISEGEKSRWRSEYQTKPYEVVTRNLLSRKATARVAPATASEQAIRDYLVRTRAI